MVSIIVCSKDSALREKLRNNVSNTIKNEYEWICIENEYENLSIFSAYNKGALKSKGDILVFIHEDVIIHTKNWDKLLRNHLNDPSLGIVGNAGSTYKSKQLTSWIDVPPSYYRSNAIAGWTVERNIHSNKTSKKNMVSEVKLLDGMFLAMRREVWEEFPFDEQSYSGFHFYDQDMSMQVGQKYQLAVCHNILVEHLSSGNYSKAWFKDALIYHKKWESQLPVSCINLSPSEIRDIEHYSAIKSLNYYSKFMPRLKELSRCIIRMFYYRPFSPYNFKVIFNLLRSSN